MLFSQQVVLHGQTFGGTCCTGMPCWSVDKYLHASQIFIAIFLANGIKHRFSNLCGLEQWSVEVFYSITIGSLHANYIVYACSCIYRFQHNTKYVGAGGETKIDNHTLPF